MSLYLAGQPFCVCLVSCWDLQPESRGVFLKGVEEMQALSSIFFFFPVYLLWADSAPLGGFALGMHPSPPKSFPHSARYRLSQGPPSCWWGLAGCTSSLGGWRLRRQRPWERTREIKKGLDDVSVQSVLAGILRNQRIWVFGGMQRPFP